MLRESYFPTNIINYLWAKVGITRWFLSAILFYHRWIPYVQSTRYLSRVFLVDDSTVTRVNGDICELQTRVRNGDDKTLIVFYFMDSKQYAVMIDLTKYDHARDDLIPYEDEKIGHETCSEYDEYLSVDYEGKDVTEAFLMYLGPLKNFHSDKRYTLKPRYSRMIDIRGDRLFEGKATTAVGILRSDLATLQHIKISGLEESEEAR